METIIIGYSIDAALYARELAEADNKITFLKTAKLGYPLDDMKDCITEQSVNKLKVFLPNLEFKKHINYSYIFLPYNSLDFVNNHNGLINYPLNKKSFECAEESEQIEACSLNLDKLKVRLENSNNYINIYKKFFPKWLYDSLVKHIAINKWGGCKQSKFTKEALYKEVNLNFLNNPNSGILYEPMHSYEDICKALLSHSNIKIMEANVDKLKKLILEKNKIADVILMDNRVDYICGYAQGKFERVKLTIEPSVEKYHEELFEINQGIVFTPLKDYWCIINDFGNVRKMYSQCIRESSKEASLLIPSIINKKIYEDYKYLLNLYSGKFLNLDTYIETTIL